MVPHNMIIELSYPGIAESLEFGKVWIFCLVIPVILIMLIAILSLPDDKIRQTVI